MNYNHFIRELTFLFSLTFLFVSCSEEKVKAPTEAITTAVEIELNPQVIALMNEYNVKGVGIGFIKSGVLVKTDYYGEQSPGIPLSKNTMFNVASTTKAITTEVFLRLAAQGEVSLDEPISDYYVYADLVDDPRHKLLTPRMILTHRTGFRNWPWLYDDEKLAFDHDPGTVFGYSGVGFYILAKFLEEKMWCSYPHLVEEIIFKPLGMKNAAIVQEDWFVDNIPTPVDEHGKYMESYDEDNGYWNPADDLHITVEDYSKFLISAMSNDGLTEELIQEREKILSELKNDPIWGTPHNNDELFPPAYGYGLGWMVFDYGDGNKNIQHGGNDQGEAAMGYFHTKSKNGLVVFCNGKGGFLMLPKMVELLDKEEQYTSVYNHIIEKYYSE